MCERYLTSTTPLLIISASTLPAPTLGSWSLSPTSTMRVPFSNAESKLYISVTSTMDSSSTTTTSHGRVLFRLYLNIILPSCDSYPNKRCIVFASRSVLCDSLLAALPVGAQNSNRKPVAVRISAIQRIIVVFPVPGPPVMTVTPFISADLTAPFWLG
ncbi:uncharacterized protein BN495_00271 [Corallococcus sp. CAG:1435]|nr:uncharacterized protein BN495_00271 [Corallococcus sp. CAG:1435]